MEITKLQLFVLMQNQVLELKTGMSLTRMAKPFRVAFKEAVGLPKRANNLDVLMAIGSVYHQFGIINEFYDYINKPSNLINGNPLVTPEMMNNVYAIV